MCHMWFFLYLKEVSGIILCVRFIASNELYQGLDFFVHIKNIYVTYQLWTYPELSMHLQMFVEIHSHETGKIKCGCKSLKVCKAYAANMKNRVG